MTRIMPLLSVAILAGCSAWTLGGTPLAWLVSIVGTLALLLVIGWRAAHANLPREPQATPLVAEQLKGLTSTTLAAANELFSLGFEDLPPGFSVNLAAPSVVLPFVHRQRGVLAAVYQFVGSHTAVDFVTCFQDGGSLTTASLREAGSLRPPAGCCLQICPRSDAAKRLAYHDEGVAWLRSRGRSVANKKDITEPQFVELLLATLRRQREALDRAPVRTVLVALWRVLTKTTPHLRPVALQRHDGGDGSLGGSTPVLSRAR